MFQCLFLSPTYVMVIMVSFSVVACSTIDAVEPYENELILIPAGTFHMGQNDGLSANEPQHEVYLDAYYIQRTEVSRLEFNRFVLEAGYATANWPGPPSGDDAPKPVVGLRWQDANAYCAWLGMRLPTEAEWEKAARGQDGRMYPWGDEWDGSLVNAKDSGLGEVVPVGSYPGNASPYGVLDMSGNAIEWVADFFAFDYYQYSPHTNPQGPDIIMDHGLRGGSFDSPVEYATTYFRDSSHLVAPNLRVGFRCAVSAAP